MARRAFLALVSPPQAGETPGLHPRMVLEPDWRFAGQIGALRLWTDTRVGFDVRVLPYDQGFVVGDLYPTPAASAADSPFRETPPRPLDPGSVARRLCATHWGAYVALLAEPSGQIAALRDPSGGTECLSWTLSDGMQVIASDLGRVPRWLLPPRAFLNWDRIALYVAMMPAASEPLLDGVVSVLPGQLRGVGGSASSAQWIWRPGDFVTPEVSDLEVAKAELVSRVDRCAAALMHPYEAVIAELSGGLDSSIVATALGLSGLTPRVTQWLNRHGDRLEGDERAYAQSVTDRLGVALTTARKPLTPLDEAGLVEMANSLWPAINSVDVGRDRDTVQRLTATGAQAIISGDGGDAVFFQMPTAMVWADAFRRRGLSALTSSLLPDVARRTHQSVWSVLRCALAEGRGRAPPLMVPSAFATAELREAAAGAAHPWVLDAAHRNLSPAKRLQVFAVTNCQLYLGASRRSARADLLFPLLAQPVVELCLSIGVPDLAGGSYDRPFARAAFGPRLPQKVLARRAKGQLTAYFARLAAASVNFLRPYLLDGCLCDAGILDRTAVARALEPDQMIWNAEVSDLLTISAVEAWVRHWQGRAPDSPTAARHRD